LPGESDASENKVEKSAFPPVEGGRSDNVRFDPLDLLVAVDEQRAGLNRLSIIVFMLIILLGVVSALMLWNYWK
ncbi:MAG: hypothetical protein V1758_15595, partial [Pseudomonadota bacterium]